MSIALSLLVAGSGGLLVPMRVAQARASPFMTAQRRENAHEVVSELPNQLAQWGCNAKLWHGMRNSGRSTLKQMARKGQEELARQRIAKMALLIEQDASSSTPAPATRAANVVSWYDSGQRLEAPATTDVSASMSGAMIDMQSAAPDGFEWGGTF